MISILGSSILLPLTNQFNLDNMTFKNELDWIEKYPVKKYGVMTYYKDKRSFEVIQQLTPTCILVRGMKNEYDPILKKWICSPNPAMPISRTFLTEKGWCYGRMQMSNEPIYFKYDENVDGKP